MVTVVHRDPTLQLELLSVLDHGRLWTQFHESYVFCHAHEQHTGQAWRYRGKAYSATTEMTMLIEPGEFHVTTRGSQAKLHILRIAPHAVEETLGNPVHFNVGQISDPTTRDSFRRLCGVARHAETEPLALDEAATAFLAAAAGACGEPGTLPATARCAPSVRRVVDYLHANFAEKVRLEQLSALAGLSQYHLCRVFGAQMGLPIHRYLTLVRAEKARTMLAVGHPISRAALDVGLCDQPHFTRVFAKIYGVTPGRYQRDSGLPP